MISNLLDELIGPFMFALGFLLAAWAMLRDWIAPPVVERATWTIHGDWVRT